MAKNKKEKNVIITGTAEWKVEYNPLYIAECPHCKAILFMSHPSFIEKLKAWAKQFNK